MVRRPNRYRTIASMGVWLGVTLVAAQAELPETPTQLVEQLPDVMQSGDVEAYAELLSPDFVYLSASSAADSLDRDQEVELYRRFLSGIESLSVEITTPSLLEQDDFAQLRATFEILVLQSPADGFRLRSIHELTLEKASAGWRVARWEEIPALGDMGGQPTWYSLKRRFADASTSVREQSWGSIKRQERG